MESNRKTKQNLAEVFCGVICSKTNFAREKRKTIINDLVLLFCPSAFVTNASSHESIDISTRKIKARKDRANRARTKRP